MFPLLYEINTRCWLRELSERADRRITLATVPSEQFTHWQQLGFTHIWLMGVWTTGPLARAQALAHSSLRQSYAQALPGWAESDVSGSPYAIADYQVPDFLGGDSGLKEFRKQLHTHGLKLILDFVPNHLGVDHGWLKARPQLFVQSTVAGPEMFGQETSAGSFWLAHGKDPYFAAWTDTVQLDYRAAATQEAMIELLRSVADRCDGVRCDMAMLVLGDVFARTWERFPINGAATHSEFWEAAIPSIKSDHPDFLFLAEAYWGLEGRLLGLGFDFAYDKTLYDRLLNRDAAGVQNHLLGTPAEVLARGAHFLENHDEPRVASILSLAEHRAAALMILALPGMRFLHQGQLTGARRRVPVQLGRCIEEAPQAQVAQLYDQLLAALRSTSIGHEAVGQVLRPERAWADNPTAQNIIAVQWQRGAETPFYLAVSNLAAHRSQGYFRLTVPAPARNWVLTDLLGVETYQRAGEELSGRGLYLDLPAHAAQLFRFDPAE